MSDFERVKEFNKLFGNPIHDEVQKNIFEDDPKTVEKCVNLIKEEFNELQEAVENKDMVETADALGDLIVVVQGMASHLGLNLDVIFDQVHKSNMSKICQSEDEAIETVKYYLENEKRYDSPSYKSIGDGKFVVYNKTTNKILKSINYKPVDLTWIMH
jgi:NTP pyrophosphatase (non-canonical NTP hydrolase)